MMQSLQLFFLLGTALFLVVPALHLSIPAALSLVGLFLRSRAIRITPIHSPDLRTSWLVLLGGFWIYVSCGLFLNLIHGEVESGVYERFIPFILIPAIAWTLRAGAWNPQNWIISIGFGSIAAGLYAFYEFSSASFIRAEGATGNAIKFGNGAVMLAAFCAFALINYPFNRSKVLYQLFLSVSMVSAVVASFLSGSKGGWLALILLAIFASILVTKGRSSWHRSGMMISALILLTAGASIAPRSLVYDRLLQGAEAASSWFETDGEVTDGSVSLRFKLWSLGLTIFSENPLLGAGHEARTARWSELVSADPAKEIIGLNTSAHNDFIEVLAEGGILGALSLVSIFCGTWLAFWKWRNHADPAIATLSWMGLFLVPMYVSFGLTVSVTGINFFRTIFVTTSVVLLSFITVRLNSQHDTPL